MTLIAVGNAEGLYPVGWEYTEFCFMYSRFIELI